MCGIAGFFSLDGRPASPGVLQRMTDAVAHRGPDGQAIFTDGAVGLGHRRLAIIDLSAAGNQPMVSVDGRHVIIYNGELYNFPELRQELEALGSRFQSRCDTEVILNAYAQWGAAAVNRFNGMFAFAIWDRQARSLFVARDRYGEELETLIKLQQAGRLPALLSEMGKRAVESAEKADKLQRQNMMGAAYSRMLEAWVYAASATDAFDILTKLQNGDGDQALRALNSLDELEKQNIEMFKKVGAIKPTTSTTPRIQ